MMVRIVSLSLFVLAAGAPLVAADQQTAPVAVQPAGIPPPMQPGAMTPPGQPGVLSPPGRPPTVAPPPQPPGESAPPRRARGQDVNLHVELTITDQTGSAASEKKTVSLMVADGTSGRVRSSAGVGPAGPGATLNIDARPTLVGNDKILLELTVEYWPPAIAREGAGVRPSALNESLSVILQNGKPLVISQAADPATDRRMTVEVRASIVK